MNLYKKLLDFYSRCYTGFERILCYFAKREKGNLNEKNYNLFHNGIHDDGDIYSSVGI